MKALRTTLLALVLTIGAALLFGFLDIAASVLDNRMGFITGRAIAAVQASPEAQTTVGAVVAAARPSSTWRARHSDDDSLYSVRVTNAIAGEGPRDSPEWCVLFGLDWTPFPSIVVRTVAPGNRAGEALAPDIAKQFRQPSADGAFYCSGVQRRSDVTTS